jgi:hypothetical protein
MKRMPWYLFVALVIGLLGAIILLTISNINLANQVQDQIAENQRLSALTQEYLNQINELTASNLYVLDYNWTYCKTSTSEGYVDVSGTVFNSGNATARNVELQFQLYAQGGMVIENVSNNVLLLGNIGGRKEATFSRIINFTGPEPLYVYPLPIFT